jgi:hypothetical protein
VRDYGIVGPRFWFGETGKSLRGDPEAQVLALYLMTSPHARMTGVYYLPMAYILADTGLTFEGASKGLRRLSEAHFCEYDEASETVFVVQMARFQIGDVLDPKDKRIVGLQKEVERMAGTRMAARFLAVHGDRFHLENKQISASQNEAPPKPLASPLQAPPKPGSGTGSGTEKNDRPISSADPCAKPTRTKAQKRPVPDDFHPAPETVARLRAEYGLTAADVARCLRVFLDQCAAKGYTYANPDAAFANCVRGDWQGCRTRAAPGPTTDSMFAGAV